MARGKQQVIVAALAACLVLGVVLIARNWFGQEPPVVEPVLLKPTTVTVARGVHLLGELAPAAAYLVETSDGLLLIDSGLEPDGKGIARQAGRLGLDLAKL